MPATERMAHWKTAGDEAFGAKDWNTAIGHYTRLFSLIEPVTERRDVRAVVAFRIGRSHVELARTETNEFRVSTLTRYARVWLREALALQPRLYQVWYERAQLLELEVPGPTRDRALADAYRSFVSGADRQAQDAGAMQGPEQERLRLARARLRELGP